MQNLIYSSIVLSSLFAPSSLAHPSNQSCNVSFSPPTVPKTFSILAETRSNKSQYLGVLQPLDEGNYFPAYAFPNPQSWSLLSNGSLTTNTTNGTLAFLWEVFPTCGGNDRKVCTSIEAATKLYVGSWTDASNYKQARVLPFFTCFHKADATELVIENRHYQSLLSNDTAGPLITLRNGELRKDRASERVTFIVAENPQVSTS